MGRKRVGPKSHMLMGDVSQVQRLPVCAECGKQKCMAQGDCCVKHVGNRVKPLKISIIVDHHGELALCRHLCNWNGNGGGHMRFLRGLGLPQVMEL